MNLPPNIVKHKKLIFLGPVLILLIVALYSVFVRNSDRSNIDMPADLSATSTSVSSSSASKSSPQTKAPLSATQRYLDAIRTYKNVGYYFQFVDCHGSPGTLTLKAGKKFMLDNRDGKSRKIAVQGGQSFTIGAYNFAIATAPSKIGTHFITCDGGGAAKIEVQK